MHDESPRSRNERWLARQLQQAACREQPQFSEPLHRRIMEAVRPTVVATNAVEPRIVAPRRRAYWLTAAWLTSAAAILVMVIAARWFTDSENRNGAQQPQSAVVQSVTKPVAAQPGRSANEAANDAAETDISKPVLSLLADAELDDITSAAANYSLDDLSRDAQATAHLLVNQLPFETPTDEWGL